MFTYYWELGTFSPEDKKRDTSNLFRLFPASKSNCHGGLVGASLIASNISAEAVYAKMSVSGLRTWIAISTYGMDGLHATLLV